MESHPHSGATPTTPERRPASAAPTGRTSSESHSEIKGWGADLDHKNRPAYPKERTPPRLEGLHWERPEEQPLRTKIYHSTERPSLTPVFGTSTPPSGVSGKLRAFAYRLSENDVRHWLLLMLADRINVVEGLVQDLMQGRIPNVLAEMGAKSEWRYNRSGFIRKTLMTGTLAAGAYYFFRRDKDLPHRAPTPESSALAGLDDPRGTAASETPNFSRNIMLASALIGTAVYLVRRGTKH